MATDNQESSIGTTTPQRGFAPSISQQNTSDDDPGFEAQTGAALEPALPESARLDREAQALIDASFRIGAAGKAKDYHSYSSLLVACMLANNAASRWFRRRLAELNVEPSAQKEKLGLSEIDLEKLAAGTSALRLKKRAVEWTQSASEWLRSALAFANQRTPTALAFANQTTPTEITARDLVAAFVFAPTFHQEDRANMGLGQPTANAEGSAVGLANGFMSFVWNLHPREYERWAEIFKREFGADPTPDIGEGPTTRLSSDRWTVNDRLGYRGYARAIRHFLMHPDTRPPLSISIQAPWGAGKTSLMRMIQDELDPEAVKAARAGGRKAQTIGALANTVSLKGFLDMIGSQKTEPAKLAGTVPRRYTIWFNAWKYESGSQLWAGLATAIIDQLSARMNPVDREKFLLFLQASRIDPAKVRSRIYDLAFSKTVNGLWSAWIWLRSLVPAAVGVGAFSWIGTNALLPGVLGTMLWVSGEVLVLFGKSKKEAEQEPVSVGLGDIITVPDYNSEIGFTHKVVEDLIRIFEALKRTTAPAEAEQSSPPPIVVFIDDLDRCSPRKVADVVEGVNMFLAGDFMPCIFIIGMDPQMVSAALETAHQDITSQLPRYDRQTPLGWRFMDKFIQLPFTIPPPGVAELDHYTEGLLNDAELERAVTESRDEARQAEDRIQSTADARNEAKRVATDVAGRRNLSVAATQAVERVVHNAFALRLQDRLSDSYSDRQPVVQQMLREAAAGFSSNPRDIKRLLNVVRFEYLLSRTRVAQDKPIPDAETMGRWIALSLRWPAFVRWLQWSPPALPGADQQRSSSEIVRSRLAALEKLPAIGSDFDKFRKETVHKALELRDGDVQWDADPGLFRYLADKDAKRLSESAGMGLY